MGSLKIGIVEDEAIIAESLKDILENLGYKVSGIASTYYEAIEISTRDLPDLFLLDITLKGEKTGIDFADYINEKLKRPFIFLTANSDRKTVENAKQVLPSAYLVKPFSKDDLFTAIEIATSNFNNTKSDRSDSNIIFVKHMDVFYKVHYSDINYIESQHIYIMIHTVDGKKYLFRKSLSGFLEDLPGNLFIQIHRGFAINVSHIKAVSPSQIVMNNDKSLPLGKVYKDGLFTKLGLG
ncbi:MAG: response regulator [Flavobacteriales bacterium]|nr:response regulator [Flavobacteriales bacterium]